MLLEAQNVCKSFQRGERTFAAVSEVRFSIAEGECVFICGKSGSGKTTLLNLLAGILDADAGTVLYEGKNIFEFTDREKSLYRNECIGYVPQSIGSLPNLSVLDNVRLPHFLFPRDGDAHGRARFLLEMLGIAHLKDELPRNLSGGETKRMLIARALINAPALLLADEPTSGLDTATASDVMTALRTVNREGAALIIVTHDREIIPADKKPYIMADGRFA